MEKYNDLSLLSENRVPQRAYYIPFSNAADADPPSLNPVGVYSQSFIWENFSRF